MSLFGTIELIESIFRQSRRGLTRRPFSEEAKVTHRGYSCPLQRAMTDFGCERSFAKAAAAVREHYGVELGTSATRQATLKHALRCPHPERVRTLPSSGPERIIAESDGSFVPVVTFREGEGDRRKRRKKEFKEVRLCTAYAHRSVTGYYANGGFNDVERTGAALGRVALMAGWNSAAKVHCLGDGARWVARIAQEEFGPNAFTLDFYHLCEYLHPCAQGCGAAEPEKWAVQQRERLKQNESASVIAELAQHLEADDLADEQAPVRRAHRYLNNRSGQLNYKDALANELPIGSGKIESAHGHLVQDRIKKSGASWLPENADALISLRVARANNQWSQLWRN